MCFLCPLSKRVYPEKRLCSLCQIFFLFRAEPYGKEVDVRAYRKLNMKSLNLSSAKDVRNLSSVSLCIVLFALSFAVLPSRVSTESRAGQTLHMDVLR